MITVPNTTKKLVTDLKKKIEKVACDGIKEITRTKGLELVNKFQSKIRTPIAFVSNAGGWITNSKTYESKRFVDVWDAAQSAVIKLTRSRTGVPLRDNYHRYVDKFPELVELAWLDYELDAMPYRIGLGEIKPTVKPYTATKRKRCEKRSN